MANAASPMSSLDARFAEIDKLAYEVQADLWQRYKKLNGSRPVDATAVLEPGVALAERGYRIQTVSSLGETYVNGVKREVAGCINPQSRIVSISQLFELPIQRFTLAHELGHEVCHPGIVELHRDVPLEKVGQSRGRKEIEADRFAASFLMPERLVRRQFAECFRVECIELTEEMAYALCGVGEDYVRERYKSMRAIAILVATTGHFNGRHFTPLNSQFRVSRAAMAIRLEGLGLIRY